VKRLALLIVVPLTILLLAVISTIPAHRQIRAVEPPLPAWDDVVATLNVANGPTDIRYLNSASQRNSAGTLGHPGVLLEWTDGRRFLIDTGMPPEEAVAFGRPREIVLGADPTETYGSLASQLGDAVNTIKGIAFTHLHSDHTDGLPTLCAAQTMPAAVFQTPLQFNELNYTTELGFEALEKATCPRQELAAGTIMPIPGFPGLAAVSLGGHTPGSTLYIARVADKYWLLSGDITNDKKSLLQNLPKHWLYSTLIVPENTRRTAQLREYLRALDKINNITVLPAHDVETMAAHLPTYSAMTQKPATTSSR
jgi:glyoxylase-like metal-dependent hydrolase (beta-lactamase superfamily II)